MKTSKQPGRAAKREALIRALRGALAKLSPQERLRLAADLGIQPTLNVTFVDPEDVQEGESYAP